MSTTSMEKREETRPMEARQRRFRAPAVDIYENASELLLIADLPGVSQKGLEVHLEKMELRIEGKRSTGASEGQVLSAEAEGYDFRRTFVLPQGIDAEKISAEMRNGVLRVHLPKSEARKPRQIPVASA